jgi:hypothetical protein
MLQPPLIQTVDTNFMGLCPAAVQIDGHGNPTFLVNRLTFPAADPFAQRFYLAHELGHWLLATDSEQTADTFALAALAGTEHQSLKKSLAALNRLHTIPYSRLQALYQHCITIDNQHKHQPLISIIMKQNLSNDLNRKIFVNHADGNDTPDPSVDNANIANAAQVLGDIIGGPCRRRAGLRVNGIFFSLESILLAALLILAVIALKRR